MVNLSPSVGKIFGIRIELHWISIVFLLIVLAFSGIYLFVIFSIVLVCIFLHELAHSITALRNNIKVKKIILIFPIGGGSVIDPTELLPQKEFRITAVGPTVNILIGLLFGIAAVILPAGMLRASAQLLFEINMLLGVLNFLPWFPLDGGRMLRSYLQKTRDFFDATLATINISKVITAIYILGASAYVLLFGSYDLATKEIVILVNLVFVVFIYSGAQSEMQYAYIRKHLSGLHAHNAVSKNYVEVKASTSPSALYNLLLRKRTHLVLFRSNGAVKAFTASFSNIKPVWIKQSADLARAAVEIPTIAANEALYKALDIMRTEEANIIAVVRGKNILGIITAQHLESLAALKLSQSLAKSAK